MGNRRKVEAVAEHTPGEGVVFDRERPLERCPGESLRANIALHDYAFMGPGRSLRKLLDSYRDRTGNKAGTGLGQNPQPPPGPAPTLRQSTISEWSACYAWQERIEAWEALLARQDEIKWAERREQLREREWDFGSKMLDLAEGGLEEGPKFIKTRRRTIKETGQEIITLAIDLLGINTTAKTGDQFLRQAAGMETGLLRHELSGPDGGPIPYANADANVSEMDDTQLSAALARLGNIALALTGGASLPPGQADAALEHPESQDPGEANP